MAVENDSDKIPLIAYISGAIVAAAPAFIGSLVLAMFTYESSLLGFLVLFILSLLGGAIGCYLLKKRYTTISQYTSTLVGFLAYIIYLVFLFIAVVNFSYNDYLILIAFIFGGIGGFRYAERTPDIKSTE
jgi:hypothetical protein